MLISKIEGVKIAGISTAVPDNAVPISSYNGTFGEDAVIKFSELTGVRNLYRAKLEQTASDLAFEAAKNLLENANIIKENIGILFFVTQKPDYRIPASSYIIHKRLELGTDCGCMDINLACSGYVYALHTAMSVLLRSNKKYMLVLTGDTSVRSISPYDKSMVMLFGDSGTATLLEKSDDSEKTAFAFKTDGYRFKTIITPAGAYRNTKLPLEYEAWGDEIIRSDYDTHMKGMDVFGFSITDVPKLISDLMKEQGTTINEYDYFCLHQANMYILKQISRKLKIPNEKLLISLDKFGNNSSNSVPLTLCNQFGGKKEGKIRIIMSGFGAGLSWGCNDINVNTETINPIIFTNNYYNK